MVYSTEGHDQTSFAGVDIYVDNYKCGTMRPDRDSLVYPINCNGKSGQYVELRSTYRGHPIRFTEIQVFGQGGTGRKSPELGKGGLKLLSLQKPASQSSVGHDGWAYRAVDGQIRGHYNSK